jgi:hypothetical protein
MTTICIFYQQSLTPTPAEHHEYFKLENYRGIGHPKAIPSFKDLVCVYKPNILFLIETLALL